MSIQKNHHQFFPSFDHNFHSTFNPYTRQPNEKGCNQPSELKFQQLQDQTNWQYFEQFKKLYFTAYFIDLQYKKIEKSKQELIEKLNLLEEKINHETKQNSQEEAQSEKLKRFRRKADQIERIFECPAQRCGRNYGSQGSLQQHIKLKHLEVFKKEQNFS